MEHFNLVVKAHQDLLAEGKIKWREHQEEVEKDKGKVTIRAGYYIHFADNNFGVLEKSIGNRYIPIEGGEGYSVDILIKKDGTFFDCVTDNGHEVFPVNASESFDIGLVSRWRKPTAEMALIDSSIPPIPPIEELPTNNHEERIIKLEEKYNILDNKYNVLRVVTDDIMKLVMSLDNDITNIEQNHPWPEYIATFKIFGREYSVISRPKK